MEALGIGISDSEDNINMYLMCCSPILVHVMNTLMQVLSRLFLPLFSDL